MYSSRDCVIKINLSCRCARSCLLLLCSFLISLLYFLLFSCPGVKALKLLWLVLLPGSFTQSRNQIYPQDVPLIIYWHETKGLSVFCYSQTSCGRPRVCLHIHLFSSPLILLGVFVKHVFTGSFLEIKRGLFALLSDCLVHPLHVICNVCKLESHAGIFFTVSTLCSHSET